MSARNYAYVCQACDGEGVWWSVEVASGLGGGTRRLLRSQPCTGCDGTGAVAEPNGPFSGRRTVPLATAVPCRLCGMKPARDHDGTAHHRAHEAINARVTRGWVPLSRSAVRAATVLGLGDSLEYEGHDGTAKLAWAQRDVAENILADARELGPLAPLDLPRVLRACDQVTGAGLPWWIAWESTRPVMPFAHTENLRRGYARPKGGHHGSPFQNLGEDE